MGILSISALCLSQFGKHSRVFNAKLMQYQIVEKSYAEITFNEHLMRSRQVSMALHSRC